MTRQQAGRGRCDVVAVVLSSVVDADTWNYRAAAQSRAWNSEEIIKGVRNAVTAVSEDNCTFAPPDIVGGGGESVSTSFSETIGSDRRLNKCCFTLLSPRSLSPLFSFTSPCRETMLCVDEDQTTTTSLTQASCLPHT